MRERRKRGAPVHSRSYSAERVWIGEGSAVYFGTAVEHFPPDGARPTGDFEGHTTLVWAREGSAWRAVSIQWIKAGLAANRAMWNDIYREGRSFDAQPNQFLVHMVQGAREDVRRLDRLA